MTNDLSFVLCIPWSHAFAHVTLASLLYVNLVGGNNVWLHGKFWILNNTVLVLITDGGSHSFTRE